MPEPLTFAQKAVSHGIHTAFARRPLHRLTETLAQAAWLGSHGVPLSPRPCASDLRLLQGVWGPLTDLRRRLEAAWAVGNLTGTVLRRHGVAALAPQVRWANPKALLDLRNLGERVILTTFHATHWRMLGPALVALELDTLTIRFNPGASRAGPPPQLGRGPDLEIGRGPGAGLRALRAGVDALNAGRTIAMATDGAQGPRVAVPFGRVRASFGRGAVALARLTGATLVPAVVDYAPDHGFVVRLGGPVRPSDFPGLADDALDRALLTAVAAEMNTWIGAHAERISPFTLRFLRDSGL